MSGSEAATAQISVPAARQIMTATRTRFLPAMSPARPSTGVSTAVLSRLTVRIQAPLLGVVPSACWMLGRAGTTIACSSANVVPATARTARISC